MAEVTSTPSPYFDISDVLADLTSKLPAGMKDLPVTKSFLKNGATVLVKASFVQQEIMKEVLKRVILYSPRKTGRLIFNWQVQINGTNNNYLTKDDNKYSDAVAFERSRAVINKWKPGQVLKLFNNAPYAKKAESTGWKGSGGGYHPPYGMLARAVGEFDSIVNEVVSRLKKG